MALKVHPLKDEEKEILAQWQRSDNVVGYRRSRIVQLSTRGWGWGEIAEALGLHIESVRQTVNEFTCPPSGAGGQVKAGHLQLSAARSGC